MHSSFFRSAAWTALGACLVSPPVASAAALPTRVAAITGEVAPGAENSIFLGFHEPFVNAAGTLVFRALLDQGPGGLWLAHASGEVEKLIRYGDPVPGGPEGATLGFSFRSGIYLNAQGEVAFIGSLGPGGFTKLLLGPDGASRFTLLAMEGVQAPDTQPGTLIGLLGELRLNDLGQSLFSASPSRGFPRRSLYGIWGPDAAGSHRLLLRDGDPAPGTNGAVFLDGFLPFLNDQGDVAIQGVLRAGVGDATPENWAGIWRPDGSGGLALIARQGSQAPGTPEGTRFGERLFLTSLNDQGRVGIAAELVGGEPSPFPDGDGGAWVSDAQGQLSLVARVGMAAPGAHEPAVFESIYPVVLSDAGEVRFVASVRTASQDPTHEEPRRGIWTWEAPQELTLLALEGEQAPAAPPGTTLRELQVEPHVAPGGDLVFSAELDPGVPDCREDGLNDAAIFHVARSGRVTVVARVGDRVEIGASDVRTVSRIDLAPSLVGPLSGSVLNDAGDVAYSATFCDGSQALLVTTVPEPGSFLLWLSALATLCVFARSRPRRSV